MYYQKMIGTKCYLSPIDVADAPKYTAWFNDLEVSRNLTSCSWALNESTEAEKLPEIAKEHNYAIVETEGNTLIGNVGLHDVEHLHRHCELGIFIGNKDYWGKGYGEEAIRLMAGYAFDYLNMRNIMLRVFDFNTRAIACYRKVGFQEIGRRRKALELEGEIHDVVLMDLLAEDLKRG